MAEAAPQLGLLASLLLGAGSALGAAAANDGKAMTMQQLAADMAEVRQGRILFSHHSVGANIIAGMQQLDGELAGKTHLRVLGLDEAAVTPGPALIEMSGGKNGAPKSKIDAFASVIRHDARLKPELAFTKLCYVDFDPRTNVGELFDHYRDTLDALKREHPEIRFAHVTVPLTARPAGLKPWLYRLLGRQVWEDAANVKRAEFNERIRHSFRADPVFDLARIEATAPDGHLTTFDLGGRSYPSLYPGYTEDGGHLNALGRRVAGSEAVRFMAAALRGRKSAP